MAISGALNFRQTDDAAACGTIQACAGESAAVNAAGRQCTVGGTAGTTAISGIQLPASSSISFAMFQLNVGQIFVSASNWDIRVNVTTAAVLAGEWTHTYVCVLNSGCTSIDTIGSAATSQDLTATGVKTHTIAVSERVIEAAESVYVVCEAANSAGSQQTVSITPDQLIDTSAFIGGPFDVQAGEIFVAGAVESESFVAGAATAEIFVAGAVAGGLDV